MARGPRTTTAVRDLVLRVFYDDWLKTGGSPDSVPTGVAVHAKVEAEIARLGLRDPVPTERVVQRMLETPRRRAREKSDIDVPWSLAWGMGVPDPLIPQDAIPDLLELKRYSLIVHRPFTVRQAQWAARLRLVPRASREIYIPDHLERLAGIYVWTLRYAGRQRRSELAEVPFDTADLDHALALDPHLHWAAIVTGHSTYRTFDEHERERESLGVEKSRSRSDVEVLVDTWRRNEFVQQDNEEEFELLGRVSESRKHAVVDLWLFWLHEFETRGQHWESLGKDDHAGLLELTWRLLEGIVAHETGNVGDHGATRSDRFEQAGEDPHTSPWSLLFSILPTPIPYIPVDLFDQVGYDRSWLTAPPPVRDDDTPKGAEQ